jgi:hypothetical protein
MQSEFRERGRGRWIYRSTAKSIAGVPKLADGIIRYSRAGSLCTLVV